MKEEIYDGFEDKELSKIWGTSRFESGAVEIQSDIVRMGNRAVKITVKSKDKFESNKGKAKDTERDEIREDKSLWAKEDEGYEYSFSVFLPKDFPVVRTRLVISQWKHHDELNSAIVDNPLIALRYSSGKFRITLQTTEEKNTLFETKEDIRGKWIDFKFHIKFSRLPSGLLRVWMNKKKIIEYKGVTAYNKKQGYPLPGRFHFRMGLYRDLMDIPMTAYFDEYHKRPLKEKELR